MPEQQDIDLLVIPRWLVTYDGDGAQALEEHAMAVRAGRIVEILPREFARQVFRPRETLELPSHAVMPGLVNTHTHAAMSLLRGIADDLPLMDWLQNHVWPAEGRHVSREFCLDGVRLALCEMIRGGQTCINDMYFFPDASAQAARESGIRMTVGLIMLDFPSAWASGPADYLHKGLAVHDALRDDPLVRTVFAPHAPYTVSDGPLREVRKYATELGIGIHMHVHETAHEVSSAVAAGGVRPWERLKGLGLVDTDLIAVHMTQLTADEIADCARHGVSVAHCPESNLKLASGFCPVAQLLAAGANVALGTDGAASNNDLDLYGEMRTAALLAKGVAGDPGAVPAAAALRMATLNGAKALGLGDETGSLAKGKSADFIAVDLSNVRTQPVYSAISHLVYCAGRDQVTHTYVAGRALMADRRLLSLDEPAIVARAVDWQQRIARPVAAIAEEK